MNNRSATPNHHHWWQHRDRSGDTLVRDEPDATPPVDEVDLRETDRDTDDETVRPEPSRVERRQYATQAPAPPAVVREEVVSSVPTDSYWSAPFWGVERLGAMAIGAFFIVMGVLTFARGDLNGSWYRPVVDCCASAPRSRPPSVSRPWSRSTRATSQLRRPKAAVGPVVWGPEPIG